MTSSTFVGGGRERPRGRHYLNIAARVAICMHPLRSLPKFESTGLPGADHGRPCQAVPRLGQAEAAGCPRDIGGMLRVVLTHEPGRERIYPRRR